MEPNALRTALQSFGDLTDFAPQGFLQYRIDAISTQKSCSCYSLVICSKIIKIALFQNMIFSGPKKLSVHGRFRAFGVPPKWTTF
jgi:hypothetical protein